MDFSFLSIDLECPKCGFVIGVLMKQVTAEETILCPGCLEGIQLIDDGGSSQHIEQELNNGLDQLRKLLG